MKTVLISLVVLVFAAKLSSSAKVFSCDQGCKDDSECPSNSHCVAINQNSECGMCLCKAGYKTQGNDCVPNKPEKSQKGNKSGGGGSKSAEKADTTTSAAATTSAGAQTTTSAAQTTSGAAVANPAPASTTSTAAAAPTPQGAPPTPAAINCADYNCPSPFPTGGDDNPFTVRSILIKETGGSAGCKKKLLNPGRPCKMNGGGTCYGIHCLTVEEGNEYCICDYDRIDRQCAVEKPGKCESATSQLPENGYKAQNKRYRNKNSPDNGSIYARHFAASLDDCVKLCTWAGGSCRSVNYGSLAGQQVCELLSVAVTKRSLLESWVVDAQGWQYATVATAA